MLFYIYFVLYELFCSLNLLDMYAFLSVFFFLHLTDGTYYPFYYKWLEFGYPLNIFILSF